MPCNSKRDLFWFFLCGLSAPRAHTWTLSRIPSNDYMVRSPSTHGTPGGLALWRDREGS